VVAHNAISVFCEVQAVIPDLITTCFVRHAMVGHSGMQVQSIAVESINSVGLR